MFVPNRDAAEAPPSKIRDYLLSIEHRTGRSKAKFFTRMGFARERWDVLAVALKQHVVNHEIAASNATRFGTRYRVEGPLETPSGRSPAVRSIWFIANGDLVPRLVTAYPIASK